MALPVINNVAKVVVRGHIGNNDMENVLHCSITSPLGQSGAQGIADNLEDVYALLLPQMNESAGFDTMEIYDLATAGGPQFTILPSTWPVQGALSGGALPAQTAGLVSLRGATGGRSGRGRTYLGGFDEGASDGELMDGACFAALQAWGDALVALDAYVIVSYYSGTTAATTGVRRKKPVPRVTPVVTEIQSAVAHALWRTQRRRVAR